MRLKILSSLILLLGFSCAQVETKKISLSDIVDPSNDEGFNGKKIARNIEADTCEGCLIGSSASTNLEDSSKTIYYLYGAEHLNLKNYYFDIPVVYNDSVKKWIKYFTTGRGREMFELYSQRAGRYSPILSKLLRDNDMPHDLIYLAMAESGFQTNAKSWARAVGPWQFMPYTGKKYGLRIDWYVDQRRDPIHSTQAAISYLSELNKLFGSWELAAAGYNAGEGKISRAIRRYKTQNFWKLREGRYLKSETKNYVPKIMALAIVGKNLESFGFESIDYHEPLDFDIVEVAAMTDLYQVADALDVDFDELKKLNPELIRWQTPSDMDKYPLRLPKGLASDFKSCCQPAQFVANDYQMHVVTKSMTLKDVSRKFKVPEKILQELNPTLSSTKSLYAKTAVVLPFRNGHSKRENMYADIYELPPRKTRERQAYRRRIANAVSKGELISNPTQHYVVQKGDTLWDVSKKTGVSLDTLIRSNLPLVKSRQIVPGDKLGIR
ncbi:MAG: transglycosylase SLT domain-containing protein [Bacteriovoracaceae bacterium]|nr:transglycosylase SLT domain-containing protein [Bacteriovoracaceae bacterium]